MRRFAANGKFIKIPIEDRFWEKVDKDGPMHPTDPSLGRCWVWQGNLTWFGYGYIWHSEKKRRLRAHRVAWEFKNGPIPRGKQILHSCDNPPCVNPDHTRPGNDADNRKDMVSRGRALVGERNPQCKITKEQVLDIKARYPRTNRTGPRNPAEWAMIVALSKKYGISTNSLSRIVRGERWKHL